MSLQHQLHLVHYLPFCFLFCFRESQQLIITEMALEEHYNTIQNMMLQGCTCEEISSALVSMGVERGSSIPNIKNFCVKYNLKKKVVVSDTQLKPAVVQAV